VSDTGPLVLLFYGYDVFYRVIAIQVLDHGGCFFL